MNIANNRKKIVVLTGAGISAESGIKTFRDSGGLWENHNIMDVASPVGWRKNKNLVINFYNERREQLAEVKPNFAHTYLAELENDFDVQIITQNVDDLHERGGSTKILHLHGELTKVRSTFDASLVYDIGYTKLNIGDNCDLGYQLRPHIVWFGEDVPAISEAITYCMRADYFIVIGTSMEVYPAANLIDYVPKQAPKIIIDPNIPAFTTPISNLVKIEKKASEGVKELKEYLTN